MAARALVLRLNRWTRSSWISTCMSLKKGRAEVMDLVCFCCGLISFHDCFLSAANWSFSCLFRLRWWQLVFISRPKQPTVSKMLSAWAIGSNETTYFHHSHVFTAFIKSSHMRIWIFLFYWTRRWVAALCYGGSTWTYRAPLTSGVCECYTLHSADERNDLK